MNRSAPNLFRKSRHPNGSAPIASGTGRVILEMGCWILGIALIAAYFLATTTLESQRSQGIELFSEARAEAQSEARLKAQSAAQSAIQPKPPVSHRLEDLPLADHFVPLPESSAESASLPIAVLRMDRIGLEVPVYSDVSELNLSRGAGWIGGTAAPNTGGNMAVAAHRDRFFRPLKDIEVGDLLELESLDGHGEFRVSRVFIVEPEDVAVLDDTEVPTVTLVTCYPFYFIGNAPQRYIVQASAVEQTGNPSKTDFIPIALQSGDTP